MDPKSEPDAETVAFTPVSPPNERDLFLGVLEIENEEERSAFLENACNGDEALRQRVEGLLNAHERTGFLEPGETVDALKVEVLADADKNVSTSGSENYSVGPEIARGGMGSIRIAEDNKLNRSVAIKVMHRDISASPSDQARFVLEAEVLAKLAHPNIVPIYDMVRENGKPLFYSMKLVKGRTLQDVLDDLRAENPDALKHYTLDRLLTIFRKVCDAMAFAHAENIIHRDLKPENIMVGEFGEVLVMDWGLSKILDSSVEMVSSADLNPNIDDSASVGATLEGSVMGTPQYMSPEQAAGEIGQMDALSDIYSLGGILYSILTLRPPVEGTDVYDVLAKVQTGNLTPITTVGSTPRGGKAGKKDSVLEAKKIKPLPHVSGGQIPSALSSVAMKALSLKKASRYRDVAAFSADIEKFQGGFATSAEQAGLGKQLMLLIKRHKALFTTAAAAWAVITALALWFVLGLRASEKAAKDAQAVAVQKEIETSKALARSATSLAEAALREGNGPAMQAALNEVSEDRRDSTWHYLHDQSDSSIARIEPGRQITGVVAHPNQPSVFAVVSSNSEVSLINMRSGERLLHFTSDLAGADAIAISPDGELIAVSSTSQIAIYDSRNGGLVNQWASEKSAKPGRLRFSPDGKLILSFSFKGRFVRLWDVDTGELRWEHKSEHFNHLADFSANGQQVIFQVHFYPSLSVLNVSDGKEQHQYPSIARTNTATLSPNGKLYVAGSLNGDLYGREFSKSAPKFEARTDSRPIERIVFSATGELFVSIATSGDGRLLIRVWDTGTGSAVYPLLGGRGTVSDVAVHPLSGELVICGSETRFWALGKPRWALRKFSTSCVAFWGADDVVFAPAKNGYAELLHLQDPIPKSLWASESPYYSTASIGAKDDLAALAHIGSAMPILLVKRTETGVELVRSVEPPGVVEMVRQSPEGKLLAIVGRVGKPVQLIETGSGEPSLQLDTGNFKSIRDLAWISDQELMGVGTTSVDQSIPGSEKHIVVWSVSNGEILHRATHGSGMDVLAVEPGGRRFAEAGTDKHVRIRDSETLAVISEFRVHDGAVTALAWHPKKAILATGSGDLTIRLWDVKTGERIDELRGPLRAPHQLAFAPSGRRLGCASLDGTTRIWDPVSLQGETVE